MMERVQVHRKNQTIAVMNHVNLTNPECKMEEIMGALGTHKQILCT